ncbi:Rhodanese-like protein [Martensiomyces pterosporus]|nr:Rhodanese-like protein [Martensiomyces pterosporus]
MAATSRISVDQLATLVRDPTKRPGVDYLVVDVRDEDYKGGHIPGAVNVPAHEIRDRAGELIDKYAKVPEVVFHCALSQVRGPKSARIYSEAVQQRLESAGDSDPLFSQNIHVLTGGFTSWLYRFRESEPQLIESFDKKYWDEE